MPCSYKHRNPFARCASLQGNVFTFLQQSGGRLPESVVVPMILEPTMSALNYIHRLVSLCGTQQQRGRLAPQHRTYGHN